MTIHKLFSIFVNNDISKESEEIIRLKIKLRDSYCKAQMFFLKSRFSSVLEVYYHMNRVLHSLD